LESSLVPLQSAACATTLQSVYQWVIHERPIKTLGAFFFLTVFPTVLRSRQLELLFFLSVKNDKKI
jgi:hypothetical protein